MHGPKNIWLTFDDGPHPYNTDRILRKLEAFNIKATFFVVGENARKSKPLLQWAFDAGHRIGNHSYTHANFATLTESQMRDEIQSTDEVIGEYAGSHKIFRPPYGYTNAKIKSVVSQLGYRIVLWNVDTLDWDRNYQPSKWVQHGLEQIRLQHESKVLIHDTYNTTADCLDSFINHITQLGNVSFEPPSSL
jgi:peptidoglycan/xylan/chitin deacetylase (PgdA/CDA1 family)